MFVDVEKRIRRKNKILFTRESACLQEFLGVVRKQTHRTLVMWAFACVEELLHEVEQIIPENESLHTAYALCRKWAAGEIKMKPAKQAILQCHQMCKTLDDEVAIAYIHAIGQGLSTVHVETHAVGLVFYALTAIVVKHKKDYQDEVMHKINSYMERLIYFQEHGDTLECKWADFLLKDKPNKEALLWANCLNQ